MKKQITRFLLVFIGVFMLSLVNAQSVVTTSDESTKGKCDGSAMISSIAVPNITSWVWKKDSVQILQQGGKDLLNLCAGNYVLEYVDNQTKKHVETFVVKTKTVAPNPCDGFSVSVTKVQNNVKSPNGCSGLIELATKGGKAPFNFTWGNNPSKTNVADKLCAGTFNGYVKDSNNCMAQFSATVGLDSTNTGGGTPNVCDGFKAIIKQTVNNTGKAPNCNGMLTAGVMGGKAPFTFTWVNANNFPGQTVQGLCGGNYYVTIKDSNNCTASISGMVQNDSTSAGGGNTNPCEGFKVELVHAQNNKKGSPNCVGYIETRLMGGKPPYKYNWSNGAKEPFIQGLCKGLYTLSVSDSNNCMTYLPSVMIGEDTTATGGTTDCSNFKVFVSKVQNNNSKDSICNGMIEVIAQGGKTPLTFNWVGTKGFGNVAQGLCAGQYYVTVKDSNNCTASTFAVVKKEGDSTSTGGNNLCANFAVKFAFIQNNISKDSTCNGMLQAEGFGGKAPYSYEWSNSLGTEPMVKGLCEGNYYVTVRDSNNCTMTVSQFIKKEDGANGGGTTGNGPCVNYKAYVANFKNNTDAKNCNGYIAINVNGKAPFNFKWANMPNAFGPTIQGLCGGNYYVTVTDSNNCITSLSQMINNEGTNGGDPTGGNGGPVSNGKPCQADMKVTPLDSTGFKFHFEDASRVDSGKVVSYTWKFDGEVAGTTNSIDRLFTKGFHNVTFTITTSLGCTDVLRDSVEFPHFDNPNGGGTGTGNLCANFKAVLGALHNNNSTDPTKCNGYAMVNVEGGKAPFIYTWTNAPQAKGNTIQGVCEGNFYVMIKDSNNCTTSFPVMIKNEATGGNNGGPVNNGKTCQAEIGGTPLDSTGLKFHLFDKSRVDSGKVITYSFKFDGKEISNLKEFDYTAPTGKHIINYTITTSLGCTDTKIDTMDFPHFDKPNGGGNGGGTVDCSSLKIELVKAFNNKQGSANCVGSIETNVIGGKKPFIFVWDNNTAVLGTNKLANICGGKHMLLVKDSNNCVAHFEYEIKMDSVVSPTNPCKDFKLELTKFVNDKSGDTICTGMIDVHTVGGLAPFNFMWNNGVKTPYNEKLCAGTYTLNVKDGNNCYTSFTQTISQDSVIVSNPCQGFKVDIARVQNTRKGEAICTGLIETRTYGGTAPYNYKWSNGGTSNLIDKLCEGSYTLIVKDKNNCASELSAVVKGDTVVNPTTTANCAGFIINVNGVKNTMKDAQTCTGAILTNVTGGKQPYNFYWSNGSKDPYLFNACAGTYTLKAVDANGCLVSVTKEIKTDSVIVTNNCTTLTANVLVKNTDAAAVKCNGALGASVSGGTAPYTFEWSNGKKSQHIDSLCEGNFSVTITDAKKCAVKVDKYVGRDSLVQNPCAGFFANVYTKNDQDGDTLCTGALLVNAGGGKLPYIYKWSNGTTEPYLKNVCKGSYAVSVFDGNNCSLTIEKYVGLDTVYNPCKNFYAKIAGVEHSGLNAAKCNGSLKVAVAGGKAPYDFTWSNGAKAPSITELCPNEYTVEVKDANKCSIVLTGKVFIDSTKNLCDGFFTKVVEVKNDKAGDNKCTGAIMTATIGGKLPYNYFWSNGAQSANIIDVCSDNYSLYVKDANNCINQISKFVGSDSIVDPCKGFNAYISDVQDYNADDTTCLGKLEATVKGGKAPFNYSWTSGDTTLTASKLCAGGYSLIITDANACNITLNGKVRMLPSKKQVLKAYVTSTDVTAAGACDGTVNVTVESGNAPYYFYHSNGEVSDSRTGVCPGVYSVIVKDSKNEVVELSYLISSPLNTITNDEPVNVPVGADTTVRDTVAATVTKDCSINYNAIDSVQIVTYKMLSKDSLLVTWAVYSAENVTYVTDMYTFSSGSGIYSVNLEMYCDEAKEIGSFLKASQSFYYAAEGTSSIVEKVKENVNVYPNPFNDKIVVKLDKVQDYQIQVMDMSGKELYTNSYTNTNLINMDLGHLASGQYILKIVSESSSFTRMIAK
jgi:hypothetical protein